MQLPPFKLERYFAQYEFKAPFLLCSSDCESFTIQDLLALEPDAADYGQTLEPIVGDTFLLERPANNNNSPIVTREPDILQNTIDLSDLNARQLHYKAIGPGTTTISSFVVYPCPTRAMPGGCPPPRDITYI